jgi:hypothetical protein
MEREILVDDGVGGEHVLKYLDESRIIWQKVTRYQRPGGSEETEDIIRYSMPGKVRLDELHKWPFTEELKIQIADFHAQFPDAE